MIRKIAAAIAPVDGFTGRRLTGSEVRVIVTDGPKPVKKSDGWFVIWDNGLTHRRIVVESPWFETRVLDLDVAAIGRKKQPSLRIWMLPGRRYPYPPGLGWREEKTAPGERMTGILDGSSGLIKPAGDYDPADENPLEIRIRYSREIEPEGMPLVIRNRDGTGAEPFTVWEMTDRGRGIGLLERPLTQKHEIKNTEICLLWQTVAGDDGICRLPKFCTLWKSG